MLGVVVMCVAGHPTDHGSRAALVDFSARLEMRVGKLQVGVAQPFEHRHEPGMRVAKVGQRLVTGLAAVKRPDRIVDRIGRTLELGA